MSSSSKRRRTQSTNQANTETVKKAESVVAPAAVKPVPAAPRGEERLGDILRRVREHRNEPLDYISDYLRIRPSFLAAIENSQYDALPADAYVIGFLRTYANYLGLDGRAAIDQYRKEMAGRRKKPQLSMPQPVSEGRAPTVAILILATILGLLVYAAWYGLSSSNRAVVTAPPLPPVPVQTTSASPPLQTAQPPEMTAPPAASPGVPAALLPATASGGAVSTVPNLPVVTAAPVVTETAASPAPLPAGQVFGASSARPRLSIRAEKESWILVFDKTGVTLFDHILKPGDVYNVPDIKGLQLTTGNGGGVVLSLNGSDLPRLSGEARIVRNVPLDTEPLKARFNEE